MSDLPVPIHPKNWEKPSEGGWYTHAYGQIRIDCPRCAAREIYIRPLHLVPADGKVDISCREGCGLKGEALLVDLGPDRTPWGIYR